MTGIFGIKPQLEILFARYPKSGASNLWLPRSGLIARLDRSNAPFGPKYGEIEMLEEIVQRI